MTIHQTKHTLTLGLTAVAIFAAACVQGRPNPPGAPLTPAPPTETRRLDAYRDAERAAQNIGMIVVSIRNVDQPTDEIVSFSAGLRTPAGANARQKSTTKALSISFDSLTAGNYAVWAGSTVLDTLHVPVVPVDPGCRTDLEVYVSVRVTEGRRKTRPRYTVSRCGVP